MMWNYTKLRNQEWAWIFREGLWNYSSRFLWIISWSALIALLIQHKYGHTNTTKHVYVWAIKVMQDIKRESWEKVDQTQIQWYVLRFEPLLYVHAFTQKDFHYVHTGPSTNGPPLRNFNSLPGVHNSSSQIQSPLHKREGTSQSQEKVYNLVI